MHETPTAPLHFPTLFRGLQHCSLLSKLSCDLACIHSSTQLLRKCPPPTTLQGVNISGRDMGIAAQSPRAPGSGRVQPRRQEEQPVCGGHPGRGLRPGRTESRCCCWLCGMRTRCCHVQPLPSKTQTPFDPVVPFPATRQQPPRGRAVALKGVVLCHPRPPPGHIWRGPKASSSGWAALCPVGRGQG